MLSSVHNAIRILQTFSKTETELGITELSMRLGLAKSTVFRLMKTLNESNLVEKNQETQKYQLGIAAFELGFTVYHSMELRRVSVPVLDKLTKTINRVIRLGVYDKGGVVYLVKRSPNGDNGTKSKIGDRIPTHCTAIGKMLLAHQSDEEVARVIEGGLPRYTNKTIVTGNDLKKNLIEVRKKDYALTMEELREGISSVAVPVKNDLGKVVGAISITGSRATFTLNQIDQYVRELRQCSRLITEQMGMDYY
ncbi:IclR family transcriptional regulator [Niallia endozanthoxylica]|uniref:Glycerol operon regulatory protein n=1 Tax=Niallia endozanthoxylica TaxID=2036016 RepID=A0A5J5GSU1_9BACI|nr:IclR family transcriptional regulator [Niallia endozanthoxylica]KAA9011396.1 IclR family transcriptional regulator [Niallia endozanthoxylica]